MGPGRFTYCYTPLGLQKGACPHRCPHGTVRRAGFNPRLSIQHSRDGVMPCPVGEAGQGCFRLPFSKEDLLPRNMTPLEAIRL